MWHAVVDEVVPAEDPVSPLSSGKGIRAVVPIIPDGRPVFVVPLADVNVYEGDRVVLQPEISSTTPFTATWRGPAVQAGRAESDGGSTSLLISKVTALDHGPYSVVAKNDCGIASSVSVVKVVTYPDPPTLVDGQRVGWNALLLSWKPGFKSGVYYGVEYKTEDMEQFRCVASALRTTTISLRHFRSVVYHIRVFSYNFGLRSRPSEEIEIDFGKPFQPLVSFFIALPRGERR
ncbi:immunoglobulin I-set domain protein [Cooperia oncophora]